MDATFLTGHFIIAMPALANSYFDSSVTYICRHDEEGAFGLVINQKTDITLYELLQGLEDLGENTKAKAIPVYLGGPVQQDHGFVLHTTDVKYPASIEMDDDIAMTTSKDILTDISEMSGPKKYLVAIGYAGWGPGQLDREFVENSWLSCRADTDIIFATPAEERFQAAADIIGVDMKTISQDSGHA